MKEQPIRLLIHGASGRMGAALLRLVAADRRFKVVAGISRSGNPKSGSDVPMLDAASFERCPPFDVAMDFSLPEGLGALVALCRDHGAALVSGTTGFDGAQQSLLESAGGVIPVVWAPNFSIGIVVMTEMARRAAAALPGWRVDIVESHHVHKKDAPSGTAISLARAVSSVQGVEPAIASVREGEIIGDHVMRFTGPAEVLEFRHSAGDRDIFARGALEAAARLHHSPARYWTLGELLFQA